MESSIKRKKNIILKKRNDSATEDKEQMAKVKERNKGYAQRIKFKMASDCCLSAVNAR